MVYMYTLKNYSYIDMDLLTDSTGQSALKSSELLKNGLVSFEK